MKTGLEEEWREAQDLVLTLRTGSLPAPIRLVSESMVPATAGSRALALWLLSAVAVWLGLSALALRRYRVGGLAVLLSVPAAVILSQGAFAAFQTMLTVTTAAGIVATVIGMLLGIGVALERTRRRRSFWPLSGLTALGVQGLLIFIGGSLIAMRSPLVSAGAGRTLGIGVALVLAAPGSALLSLLLGSAAATWMARRQTSELAVPGGADTVRGDSTTTGAPCS